VTARFIDEQSDVAATEQELAGKVYASLTLTSEDRLTFETISRLPVPTKDRLIALLLLQESLTLLGETTTQAVADEFGREAAEEIFAQMNNRSQRKDLAEPLAQVERDQEDQAREADLVDQNETFDRFADEDEATKAESIARILELLEPLPFTE